MTFTNTQTTELSLDQLLTITGGVYHEPGTPEREQQDRIRKEGGITSTSVGAPINIGGPGYPPITDTPGLPTPAPRFPR